MEREAILLKAITLLLAFSLVIQVPLRRAYASPLNVIFVNTASDNLSNDGYCSLREAIQAANLDTARFGCPAGNGADVIILGAGNFVLTLTGPGEDNAQSGDLDITGDLTILGAGAASTVIDGKNNDRVFHILNSSIVKISGLTIQNGYGTSTAGYYGGGILNMNGDLELNNVTILHNNAVKTGGGIDNASTTRLTNVTLSGNVAENGGGIFNDGTLILTGVTLTGNSASNTGGGIDNKGTAFFSNVTFSENTAVGMGGGFFNDGNNVTVLNTTFYENSTAVVNAGEIRFKNTLVANSVGNNCTGNGTFTSVGHNLDSGNTCKFNHSTDIINVADPKLDSLQDNGGLTLTHALLPGSPAIDTGENVDCPATDQRGYSRPADGDDNGAATCDIGAFEYGANVPGFVYLPIVTR